MLPFRRRPGYRAFPMAALVAVFSFPALARMQCQPREMFIAGLRTQHQEVRTAIGMHDNGNMVELFVAPDGGWSILVTKPGGTTCMAASGENCETIEAKRGEPS